MKIFKVLLGLVILSGIAISGYAQANQTLNLPNSNGKLFRYGYEGILTTRDSGYHTIAILPVAANEAGVIEAQVVGKDSLWHSCTGSIMARYEKDSSSDLTLSATTSVFTKVTSEGISGATFAFDTLNRNVILKVKGDTATVMNWITNIRWLNKK